MAYGGDQGSSSQRDESGFNEEDLKELVTRDEIELQAILDKYKKIEGEWSLKDVEKFAQEITGNNVLTNDVKLTDTISNQGVKSMRDGTPVSATLV